MQYLWKKGFKETKCESRTKDPLMNRVIDKEDRSSKSLNVVSSTYGIGGINRRQYVALKNNDQEVRLQLDPASDMTLI